MKLNLIVFHSRTGHSRTVAAELARHIEADCEEVVVENKARGLLSYLASAWAALTRKTVPIRAPEFAALRYARVIIGGPTWAGHVCPPILSWLDREGTQLQSYAAWVTQGGSGARKALKQLEEEIGHPPEAVLILTDAEIEAGEFKARVADFAAGLVERNDGTIPAAD
ncbi:flavodoxin family protein [Thalassovita aquimarina]|uniref:Flavodoxin n=1 Tax=Thalassovita aquimarina TaxID=2785917 RepID=A0ABS5HL78_9RHOB|nr:hypothetical protein [Thalassovita aquimarina]MBR9649586.1 hypothetical protein [Thalassovita aquimarina]